MVDVGFPTDVGAAGRLKGSEEMLDGLLVGVEARLTGLGFG